MRTSPSQFNTLITFMEQHGDLYKSASTLKERLSIWQLWDKLIPILNNDETGESKSPEKWKKVWSDYKNNVKKKFIRIHNSIKEKGGSHDEMLIKFSDLEQRVLQLIGVDIDTGLPIGEVGSPQAVTNTYQRRRSYTMGSKSPVSNEKQENFMLFLKENSQQDQTQSSWNEPESPTNHFALSTASQKLESSIPIVIEVKSEEVETLEPLMHDVVHNVPYSHNVPSQERVQNVPCNFPSSQERVHNVPYNASSFQASALCSPPLRFEEEGLENDGMVTPTHFASPLQSLPEVHIQVQPSCFGQTTNQHCRRTRNRRKFRRFRPTHTNNTDHSYQTNEEWRNMRIEQHKDYMYLRREQNRIREMELQVQKGWQELGHMALGLLEKTLKKYCTTLVRRNHR